MMKPTKDTKLTVTERVGASILFGIILSYFTTLILQSFIQPATVLAVFVVSVIVMPIVLYNTLDFTKT